MGQVAQTTLCPYRQATRDPHPNPAIDACEENVLNGIAEIRQCLLKRIPTRGPVQRVQGDGGVLVGICASPLQERRLVLSEPSENGPSCIVSDVSCDIVSKTDRDGFFASLQCLQFAGRQNHCVLIVRMGRRHAPSNPVVMTQHMKRDTRRCCANNRKLRSLDPGQIPLAGHAEA